MTNINQRYYSALPINALIMAPLYDVNEFISWK